MIAKLHGAPYWDFVNKIWLITFEVKEQPTACEGLMDKALDLVFKVHRQKRSLDANAYCWVLCTKMAQVLNTSKDEVYEEMIQRYSVLDTEGESYITVTIRDTVPVSKLGGHWKFVTHKGNFISYIRLKGSSEMDTKEMATLIDGIVSECKDLGIETATPNELERMVQQWRKLRNDHTQ